MKRILIFSFAYEPFVGGAEIATHEIAQRLVQRGWRFDVVTARFISSFPREEELDGVRVVRVGPAFRTRTVGALSKSQLFVIKMLYPLAALWAAVSLQKKESFQATWSIMASYGGVAASLFSFCFCRTPLVLTLQEGDEEDHLTRYVGRVSFLYKLLIRPWYRLPFRRARRATAISSSLKERANSVRRDLDVVVVPNGVHVEDFEQAFSHEERAQLRRKFGLHEKNHVVLSTSRLVEKNGIDRLIRAAQFVPEDTVILLVGDGPRKEEYVQLATDLSVRDRVVFAGHVSYGELPRYVALADVFCRPSRSEGLGNSFLEAMAAGVPVIGTHVGGIVDFLFDPDINSEPPTGLVVSGDYPDAIARAINRFRTDEDLRHTCVSHAQKLIRDRFQWDAVASQMEAVFDGVIGNES